MQVDHSHLDITFTIDSTKFHVSFLLYGRTYDIVQSHTHGNGCYEAHYISQGYGHAIIDGVVYNLSPGTLYMTGPHIEHSYVSDKENRLWEYCVYFYVPYKEETSSKNNSVIPEIFLKNVFWFGNDSQNVLTTLEQLFYEFEHKHIGYQQNIEILLKQFVIKLVRNYEKNRASKKQYAHSNLQERSTRIIEEHFLFQYQNSNLEELASQLGLSTRQTQRLIKKQYGKTYIEKRIEARMAMATTLLTETNLSISEISVKLGFGTVEHFSNTFKNHFGISAKDYRKQQREIPDSPEFTKIKNMRPTIQ